jgi:hypothetical protein
MNLSNRSKVHPELKPKAAQEMICRLLSVFIRVHPWFQRIPVAR